MLLKKNMKIKLLSCFLIIFIFLTQVNMQNVMAAESAPTIVSAITDHIGKKITLTFDKPMADPAGTQNQFTVVGTYTQYISSTNKGNLVSGNIPVTSVALGSNSTEIILSMSTAIQTGTTNLDYTSNGSVQASDGTQLQSFAAHPVTNNNICSVADIVDFDYDATEIGYDNTTDPSNPILKYKFDKPVDYDNVQLAWYFYNGFFTPMVDNLNNYVKFYEKDTNTNVVLPNILTRPNAPATYKDGTTKSQQIVTDWYFWQLQHYAPLGLNLVSQSLKPSTTYVIEIDKGFKFNNLATIQKTFFFEFTTTADSLTKPYWADGSSVTTSNITENGLTLAWPAAQDNHSVTGYKIYKNDELLTTVDGNTTSYDVSDLSSGTKYKFKVEAMDFANNCSSIEATQMTVPAAPSVTADDTSNKIIGIDTTMEYSIDGGNWTKYDSNPDLSGAHTVTVRVAADSATGAPAGSVTTLNFTANPTHTVNYDGNGSVNGNVPVDSGAYLQGAIATVLGNTEGLSRSGYTFAGWNTSADGSGTNYIAGTTFTVGTENTTLYAKWTANSTGGGSTSTGGGSTSTGGGGTPVENTSNTVPVQVVEDNSTSVPTAVIAIDSSVIAKDKVNEVKPTINDTTKAVELKMDADSIKGGTGSLSLNANNLTINMPFSVIDYSTAGTGTFVKFNQSSTTNDETLNGVKGIGEVLNFNLGLYASNGTKISEVHQFNQGKVDITIKLTDEQIKNLNTSKLTAYYYNEVKNSWQSVGGTYDASTKDFKFSTEHFSKYTIAETITENQNTVVFDSQGGSLVQSKTIKYNSVMTAPTLPTKTGYTFKGWYKDAACTTPWNFETDKVTSNITLYAKWTVSSYTVTFNSQGGSVISSKIADYNNGITAPAVPIKSGNTFAGWYKEAECINAWNFTTDKVTANTTLYAKWKTNSYAVTFNSQGGSEVSSKSADYNNGITAPAAPTKAGNIFAGWYKEAGCINAWNFATDKVTANTTLYAKWKINNYTVTFNSQGGSLASSKSADYNNGITAPATPTKAGNTFVGWYKEAGCINAWNFTTDKVTANTMLYAKWKINSYTVNEGSALKFTVNGTDADGDKSTYSALGLPKGASFDGKTKIFKWTPNYTQSGTYKIKFKVSDGKKSTTQEISIVVKDVDRAPVILSIGNKTINEGSVLKFTVNGTDADGDKLTYSASGLPKGASFDGKTKTFKWTPNYTQSGTYKVKFKVSDGNKSTTQEITIVVKDVDRAPVILPIGNKTINEGSVLNFTVNGTDADGDKLTYSVSSLPKGASFDGKTKTFKWTPNYTQSGTYKVKFTVSDGKKSTTQEIKIVVNNINKNAK